MSPLERVREYFKTLPFSLEVNLLAQSTHTSPLAAEALGVEVGQIAKTLVFTGRCDADNKPQGVVVVTSGDVRVDTKKLKILVGFKPKFADGDEAQLLTGYPPGGVCPFDLPQELPVFIDVSMRRFPLVFAAGGTANSAVPVTIDQLLFLTKGSLCDVCYL